MYIDFSEFQFEIGIVLFFFKLIIQFVNVQAKAEEQAAKDAVAQKQEDFTAQQENWNPDAPALQSEVTDVSLTEKEHRNFKILLL
jgi:Na+-transporting methylmalonyl-CoA/oxaloacetate decarboxylase gamma subunit